VFPPTVSPSHHAQQTDAPWYLSEILERE
jgi:hypothetical protein